MMTDLPHLASRLFGTPLLVARPKFDVILGVLGPRLAGSALEPIDIGSLPARDPEITAEGIAIVPVTGTLVSRSGYLAAASGLMSYGDIGDAIEAAANDPRVRGIVIDIDSPGGEVGGLFDLVDRIGAIRRNCGKPIHAVANEAALSAAYAIACAADSITITQTGEVGSVGVVAVHVDESAADAKAGLAWTFVHAGERKVDGNPHAPLSSRARADIQADVDRLYDRFVALVAAGRNVPPEAIRATEAGILRGEQAVRAGLADRVGTLRQAVTELAKDLTRKSIPRPRGAHRSPIRKEAAMQTEPMPEAIVEEEGAVPEPKQGEDAPVTTAPLEPVVPDPVAEVGQRLRAEYAELAAIAAQAARLGVRIDAADAMAKGVRPDALRRSVLDELAARSDAVDLIAAAAPAGSKPAAESPIVKRAREAASRT
ncbi:MAG: S49 family peptidase [Rhodospirillales bacterium]|jgi:signal peptide peptidase SppA|nr:S49 family peptidase [Rhodospirillales bacterium]